MGKPAFYVIGVDGAPNDRTPCPRMVFGPFDTYEAAETAAILDAQGFEGIRTIVKAVEEILTRREFKHYRTTF